MMKKWNYWDNYKKDKCRYTLTFTEEENKSLLSDLNLAQIYTKNFNLKIKDVLKKKGLSNRLLSPQELALETRKLELLEEYWHAQLRANRRHAFQKAGLLVCSECLAQEPAGVRFAQMNS